MISRKVFNMNQSLTSENEELALYKYDQKSIVLNKFFKEVGL